MDTKSNTKRHFLRAVVILGVILIPLLYSFFYLGAFWDPYAKLDTLPVAVVNEDAGARVNGAQRNLGQEMCDELAADGTLKFVFTDASDAQAGTEGTKYYATITIPRDFSQSIASASTSDKQAARLTFCSNEKRNYLAAQILGKAVDEVELKIRGKVNAEIVDQLCAQLRAAPDQLTTLVDGLGKLSDGAGVLRDGTDALAGGASQLRVGADTLCDKLGEFSSGVKSADGGAAQLLSGLNSLRSGIDALADGAKDLDDATADLGDLRTGAATLAQSAESFNQGIISYTDGVSTLVGTVEQMGTFLKIYAASHPDLAQEEHFAVFLSELSSPENLQQLQALKNAAGQLKTASAQIADGARLLSDSTADLPTLKAGVTKLKDGIITAQSGAAQATTGADSLKSGLGSLSAAAGQLKDGAETLADGAAAANDGALALKTGAGELKAGLDTAHDSVSATVTAANYDLSVLDGLGGFASAPVVTDMTAVDPVPNYGTAFAPYFLCLSLWVGALIIFFGIYLDADSKFAVLSRTSERKVLRCFLFLLIGFGQALLLGVILRYCLGLQVNHVLLYYFGCCLISMVFISIVQFLLVFLKDAGKFLAIALLILQLTSCGGTFPMETVPKFFNALYPFMPMTYAVNLLKDAISATQTTYALPNALVLGGILVVFTALTLVCSTVRRKKREGELSAVTA